MIIFKDHSQPNQKDKIISDTKNKLYEFDSKINECALRKVYIATMSNYLFDSATFNTLNTYVYVVTKFFILK
jgi:hypothetical protein